jgi:hypothetical protein
MRIITHCKKTFPRLGKGLIIILLIIAPFIGINMVYPNFLSHLNDSISQHRLVCTLFRWAVLMIFYISWPIIFQHIGKLKHWSSPEIIYWIRQRTKVITWLILFELIVCEELFLVLFNFWKHY